MRVLSRHMHPRNAIVQRALARLVGRLVTGAAQARSTSPHGDCACGVVSWSLAWAEPTTWRTAWHPCGFSSASSLPSMTTAALAAAATEPGAAARRRHASVAAQHRQQPQAGMANMSHWLAAQPLRHRIGIQLGAVSAPVAVPIAALPMK